jgi:hypothetical protein
VQSKSQWTPGATISLTIEDGGGVVYADSQTADTNGYFNFNLWDVFDLERGHEVTVSDGTTTKTHTVTNLFVDGVDVTGDVVFGRADAGTSVDVWVYDNGNLTVTADDSGNWAADFSGMTDLTYLSDGRSKQTDSEGDFTKVQWDWPKFKVAPDDDWVQSSSKWTPGATISLTIEDDSGVVYADSQTTDTNGNFDFDLWDVFDLERGQVVTVSDGTNTKTHTVTNLFVDGVDVTGDDVFGRADVGTTVDVRVYDNGNLTVTADDSGNWTADFSGMTDLTYLSDGRSKQTDRDGDFTRVQWESPRFDLSPDKNYVGAYSRWTAGATISLTIEDSSGVVYADSQTADTNGDFNFDIEGVDLVPGHLVTVSDGTTIKTHVVIDVDVSSIDTGADQVHGSAEPGAEVRVRASLGDEVSRRTVIADSGGNWMADFSVAADWQPIYDITNITRIRVHEFDDDGDSTFRQFGPPNQQNRGVAVTAIDNHVWVANSGVGAITRLDNDGNVVKVIDTGEMPTGVAVDAAGKVWTTNMGSNNTVRIDPNAGLDGLGAIDLTVDLGPWARPYNYSDMTGAVVVGSTSPQGFWTVVQDSGTTGFEWGRVTWNNEPEGSEPPGTAIIVEARAADTEAGLGGQPFQSILNGDLFSMFGRYIEVRVTLKASSEGLSPVLSDIRVIEDFDGDGIADEDDNAPNDFNPDQSDLDGDGVGDIADVCPTDPDNSCDPDGSAAVYINADEGGTLETNDGSVQIEIPPGALDQGTSVSITDTDSGSIGFELTNNLGVALGFFSVDLQPSPQDFQTPITIIFAWLDADDDGWVDGTVPPALEENLIITQDNNVITGRCRFEPTCDTSTNAFTFQVSNFSEFALGWPKDTDGDDVPDDFDNVVDNCLLVHNPDQTDSNKDYQGDACDLVVTSITAPIEPINFNAQPVNVSGTFADPTDDNNHAAEWDWGDNTTPSGTVDQGENSVAGIHSYEEPGVYTLKLTVTDDYPSSDDEVFEFIVVYDSDSGFVTGGGWFISPEDACLFDACTEGTTGKASFGFVSKYEQGASIPTGNTEFQFKAGNLNFHSDTYQWLVVNQNSTNAQFKGSGTINGEISSDGEEYKFMIWATDSEPDTFRIKIWWENENGVEQLVYDNGSTDLGGGNILVHK